MQRVRRPLFGLADHQPARGMVGVLAALGAL